MTEHNDTPADEPAGSAGPQSSQGTTTTGPRVTREEVKDVGRLRRTTTDRHIAGVAGGIARHLDIDPVIVRVALVVGVFFGGAGLLAYGAAWLLVPEDGDAGHPLGLDERSRVFALIGAGVLAVLVALGDWAGAFWFPWPIAIIALAVLWFVNRGKGEQTWTPPPPDSMTGQQPAAQTYAAQTYAAQAYAAQPYAAQPYVDEANQYAERVVAEHTETVTPTGYPHTGYYAPPPNPRKRGPRLFWMTLALIALAEGVLGMVDLAGADIVPSAYPALALGVTTAMLILGAFWGRAGGLILVGLVSAVATLATSIGANDWEGTNVSHTPTSAVEVEPTYELGAGNLVVDLSQVEDIDNLDGRDISIDGFAGTIEVIVPAGMDVSVDTTIVGGDSQVFDQREDGGDVTLSGFVDGGAEAPDMKLAVDLVFGEILVRTN